MDDDLAQLAEERKAAAPSARPWRRARAAAERREEELREREEAFKRKVTDRVEERVRAATREIDAVVQALKRQTSALTSARGGGAAPVDRRSGLAARSSARAAVEAAAARAVDGDRDAVPAPSGAGTDRIASGARRRHASWSRPSGCKASSRAIADGQAEIDVHGKRLRARARDLTVLTARVRRKPSAGERACA